MATFTNDSSHSSRRPIPRASSSLRGRSKRELFHFTQKNLTGYFHVFRPFQPEEYGNRHLLRYILVGIWPLEFLLLEPLSGQKLLTAGAPGSQYRFANGPNYTRPPGNQAASRANILTTLNFPVHGKIHILDNVEQAHCSGKFKS